MLGPALQRPASELSARLLFGVTRSCVEKLAADAAAGLQRVFLWPLVQEERQLDVLAALAKELP